MASYHRRILWADEPISSDCGYLCFPSSPSPAPVPSPLNIISPSPVPSPEILQFLPNPTAMGSGNKQDTLRIVIIAVTMITACSLVLTCYAVVRRYCSIRRHRALAAAVEADQPPPTSDAGDEIRQDLLVGGGMEEPYHVWYIRTTGLDEATIRAIAAYAYKKGDGLVEGTDCAVCLGEFRDGEMLRLLPKCSHAFHTHCIDTWLRSHVNCPLCRTPILDPPGTKNLGSSSTSAAAAASNAAASELGQNASATTTTTEGDFGAAGSSLRRRMPDERTEDGNAAVVLSQIRGAVAQHWASSLSHEESEDWLSIDLGEGQSEDGLSESVAFEEREGNGHADLMQQVRRSISMDSSALGGLLLRTGLAGFSGDNGRKPTSEVHTSATKNGERQGNNCKRVPLWNSPHGMERSMSSSGGRLCLSRFSGRPRSAILPL